MEPGMPPPPPPPVPMDNVTAVFHSLFRELTKLYRDEKLHEARKLALLLYQEAALPMFMRAVCCTMLGTGDGDYLAFAREGVTLTQEILDFNPTRIKSQRMLRQAQNVLDQALADHQADQDAEAAKVAIGLESEEAGEEVVELDMDSDLDETLRPEAGAEESQQFLPGYDSVFSESDSGTETLPSDPVFEAEHPNP